MVLGDGIHLRVAHTPEVGFHLRAPRTGLSPSDARTDSDGTSGVNVFSETSDERSWRYKTAPGAWMARKSVRTHDIYSGHITMLSSATGANEERI